MMLVLQTVRMSWSIQCSTLAHNLKLNLWRIFGQIRTFGRFPPSARELEEVNERVARPCFLNRYGLYAQTRKI